MGFDRNLAPVEISLAPIGSRPTRVQVVERAVTILQPLLKLLMSIGIGGFIGVLVVNLPSQDVGIVTEAFRHLLSHFAGEFAIFRIREIEVLPVTMFGAMPFFIDSQRLRIFLGKPSWRSRRRCADY